MKKYNDGGIFGNMRKNMANNRMVREENRLNKKAGKILTAINSGTPYEEMFGVNNVARNPIEQRAQDLYQMQLNAANAYTNQKLGQTATANQNTINELNQMGEGYKKGGAMRNTLLNNIRFK
jgi:hypothetical protein